MKYEKKNNDFQKELKVKVEEYFQKTKQCMTGDWRLYLKTIILITAWVACYAGMLSEKEWTLGYFGLWGLFGLLTAFIGFNVMHDGSHESFSSKRSWNVFAARILELMGASSFLWKIKHVTLHHTFVNTMHDDDIQAYPLLRFHHEQKRLRLHRYQHLYSWLLYCFLYLGWVFIADPVKYFRRKIHRHPIPQIPQKEHWIFFGGKVAYVAMFLVVPGIIHGAGAAIIGFLLMSGVCSFLLSLVFQLAHVNEASTFPSPEKDTDRLPVSWAESQVRETTDFAVGNKVIAWILGGLNYQTIHHLFPRISHIHYPALVPIIESVCRKHGITYNKLSLGKAISSHYRQMKSFGRSS